MTCCECRSILDRIDATPVTECGSALRHIRECAECRSFIEAGASLCDDSHARADVRAADELAGRLAQHVIHDPEAT